MVKLKIEIDFDTKEQAESFKGEFERKYCSFRKGKKEYTIS